MFIYEQCVHVLIILQLNQQNPIIFIRTMRFPSGLMGWNQRLTSNASSLFSAVLQQDQPKGYPTHPDPRQD